jgi:hypothetical protein
MRNTTVFGVMIITALTVTFLPGQAVVWDQTWDSGRYDYCGCIALDTVNGAVYLAGYSRDGADITTEDIVTLKYDTDGNFEWAKEFDSDTTDEAFDVAADKSGFIYVTGQTRSQPYNRIRLIKYNANGDEIWNVLHEESNREEVALGVTTDATGNIYVTGPSWGQARTVKFTPDGDTLWSNAVNVTRYPFDIVVAPNGSIYTTGLAQESTDDPFVIRYNTDGDTIWSKLYDLGAVEFTPGIDVDEDNNLYLTGTTKLAQDSTGDILILKLDADGNLLWNKEFDFGQDESGECIAVDDDYVYVAGRSYNTSNYTLSLPLLCYDKQGNLLWDTLLVSGAQARGIVSDEMHNLYISAQTSSGDFRVIKVHHSTAVEERPDLDSPILLEVLSPIGSNVSLEYSLGNQTCGILTFYSADGRLIESFTLSQGASTFTWNTRNTRNTRNTPSGVYFARLVTGSKATQAKICLIK